MPRLFTSTSASGTSASRVAVPASVVTSAATPRTVPPVSSAMRRAASTTDASERPFTTTDAPAEASPRAIANPMPPLDAVTTAVFPCSSIRRTMPRPYPAGLVVMEVGAPTSAARFDAGG
jgi:hypothetical protein